MRQGAILSKTRIAIAGCGVMGKAHMQAVLASGQCGDDGEGGGGHQLPPEDCANCLATKADHGIVSRGTGIPHCLAAAFYAAQSRRSMQDHL